LFSQSLVADAAKRVSIYYLALSCTASTSCTSPNIVEMHISLADQQIRLAETEKAH
jgi:hypothetical protein